jgi:hypothetical protein
VDQKVKLSKDYLNNRSSVKMYKRHITLWNLRKNTREEEALAMIRKKSLRDAAGKESAFRVRGKPVSMENVFQYFKRKGISDPETSASNMNAPTPSALSCWTPTPSSSPKPHLMEQHNQSQQGPQSQFQDNLTFGMPIGLFCGPVDAIEQIPGYLTDDQIWGNFPLIQDTQVLEMLSPGMQSFQIPRSPSPPLTLMIQEKLFFNVNAYVRGSHEGGMLTRFEEGMLTNIKSTRGDGVLGQFSNLWTTGSQFMLAGSFIEGRRVFSKVSELLVAIVQEGDPSSLGYLLEMLLDVGRKLPKLAALLRTHMNEMARSTFPQEHPWRNIMSVIANMDEPYLNETLFKSWGFANDVFEKSLGQFHPNYISSYTQYVSCVEDPVNMERIFRNLVEEGEFALLESDDRFLRLRCEHAWSLFHKGNYHEALASSNELLVNAWKIGAHGFEIDCLRLSATCQHQMGSMYEAETNLREAIKKLRSFYGQSHPRALRFIMTLQGWLREWGREDEANVLNADVDALLGPDDINDVEVAA